MLTNGRQLQNMIVRTFFCPSVFPLGFVSLSAFLSLPFAFSLCRSVTVSLEISVPPALGPCPVASRSRTLSCSFTFSFTSTAGS
eukprot:983210-Pyramimonas_sp.AAC.2